VHVSERTAHIRLGCMRYNVINTSENNLGWIGDDEGALFGVLLPNPSRDRGSEILA
jgi:hypothetical protein